ncbi:MULTISPECIES: restriction endonuclease subunit S [Bacillus]|uniref:Type I restriction-modification enzyme, S subunit, putative n=1 Tax=Bacillus amyloliquefaciens (strain Y2) TaxID=1155777 RepID=I2C8L6_BACAY|nr:MULTISPECIES: restriction endonuclease subunit S [Bacillus]AFJ62990.1 type I restriction-modification enzyme, S subunit, putative [Bacillus velezensis YAU B9601-Y2]AJE79546.1 restriction endonuclease subunit S [Bacillus sp. BH072]AUG36865.1 restriction endonuclease subunit S [Bacillus velezensis]KFI17056.1 restriction endonuclease subunit S [Bacillus velezensis]KOC84329.1 restriction endonuclease subunit S [Bacillus velezensis]
MSKTQKTIEELMEEVVVPHEEQPYQVPENWMWVNSGHILNFIGGGTPSKSNSDYWNGDIPWATVKDIKNGYLSSTIDYITVEGLENSSATMASPNELLLITRMSPGKSAITKISTTINQDLKIVRPKIEILPYFLWLFFTMNTPLIESMSTGSTVKGIQVEKLKKITFPLPPFNEQKRIADKVERLLSKIEKAKQLIEEAKETFELRRAAILDKAFRGELTRKWRGENHKKSSDTEVVQTDKTLYNLPFNWKWVDLDTVCEKITDGTHHSPKSYPSGDYMYITAKNIKKQGILLDNVTYVSKEVHQEIYNRCDVKKGDVLYIKDGATTGIATVNQITEEFSLLSSVALLRPKRNVLAAKYLMYCLNSPSTKSRMLGMISGNAITRLTLKKIKQGIIPLPPFNEQEVIVSILEKVNSVDEQLDYVTNLEDNINNLKQSILSKAFRGELGTNNPSEENAIELLKEVLQEQVK